MNVIRSIRRLAVIGTIALIPAAAAGATEWEPHHDGPPDQWGPPLYQLCDAPAAAAAAGYNVVILTPLDDVYVGTPQADAIYARPGNDDINGAGGDDLICLGPGKDLGQGANGNDAVFGEEDEDELFGGFGNDFLHGGPAADSCAGGFGVDVLVSC
jgi:hypothetical protein